jgi:hypothetical protein
MRHQRVIQLGDLLSAENTPAPAWRKRRVIDTARTASVEDRWRDGDMLHIKLDARHVSTNSNGVIEIEHEVKHRVLSALVEFPDILDATKAEVDDDWHERPWDHCDDYEHHELDSGDAIIWLIENAGDDRPRGYYRSYTSGRPASGYLFLDDMSMNPVYEYARDRGASKQVARERAACTVRHALDQLREWYSDGWYWYWVSCEFYGYTNSICGYLDEDDAETYGRQEVASDIAYQMEADGYTVINRPAHGGWTPVQRRKHMQLKLNEQNWSHD